MNSMTGHIEQSVTDLDYLKSRDLDKLQETTARVSSYITYCYHLWTGSADK